MPPLRRLDTAGDAVRQVIRAYHGSPYDFDRFDASKIGTGEGAQSYGHGLYFGGREGVARSYRDKLSAERDVLIGGVPSAEYLNTLRAQGKVGTSPEWMAVSALREYAPEATGVDDLFDSAVGYWPEDTPVFLRALEDLRRKNVALGPRHGRMYEVEISQPEEALLDWDRPMGESVAARMTPKLRGGLERGIRDRLDMGQLGRHADNLRAMRDNPALAPGQVLHEGLSADYGRVAAARGLLDAGIPGIRYLDQGSRAAGEGTRNYVIFPGAEDSIRILRKYGLMAPVAAGAMDDGEQ